MLLYLLLFSAVEHIKRSISVGKDSQNIYFVEYREKSSLHVVLDDDHHWLPEPFSFLFTCVYEICAGLYCFSPWNSWNVSSFRVGRSKEAGMAKREKFSPPSYLFIIPPATPTFPLCHTIENKEIYNLKPETLAATTV